MCLCFCVAECRVCEATVVRLSLDQRGKTGICGESDAPSHLYSTHSSKKHFSSVPCFFFTLVQASPGLWWCLRKPSSCSGSWKFLRKASFLHTAVLSEPCKSSGTNQGFRKTFFACAHTRCHCICILHVISSCIFPRVIYMPVDLLILSIITEVPVPVKGNPVTSSHLCSVVKLSTAVGLFASIGGSVIAGRSLLYVSLWRLHGFCQSAVNHNPEGSLLLITAVPEKAISTLILASLY